MATLTHWERPKTIIEVHSFMGTSNNFCVMHECMQTLWGYCTKCMCAWKFHCRKGSMKNCAFDKRQGRDSRASRQLSLESWQYSLSIGTEDSCSGQMNHCATGVVLEDVPEDGSHVSMAFWSSVLVEGQHHS